MVKKVANLKNLKKGCLGIMLKSKKIQKLEEDLIMVSKKLSFSYKKNDENIKEIENLKKTIAKLEEVIENQVTVINALENENIKKTIKRSNDTKKWLNGYYGENDER